ncbi:hypothetical protein [Rhizobium leguminosarum]|uniref:hypothetical protein n=1 Tax=Rhizobium leguminosarum TaxID=384 RepID=UPI0002D6979E|nr:hypothetical protein [Rhizobium leguminosarum]
MTKVAFNISMSLDGFITAGNQTREEPLGKNGEFLHDGSSTAVRRAMPMCNASPAMLAA